MSGTDRPAADELPEHPRMKEGPHRAVHQAKRELESDRQAVERSKGQPEQDETALVLEPERFTTRSGGRRNWLREARRWLDEQRRLQQRPVPRSRSRRLAEAARRLEQDHAVEVAANAQYEAWRGRGIAADGTRRMAPGTTKAYRPSDRPAGTINTSDPDSRVVRTKAKPPTQGYNVQAAVTERQILVAAEVTVDSPDFGHLQPMVDATLAELDKVGISELPDVVVADPGYWHTTQMDAVVGRGIQVLIPPDSGVRKDTRPGWDKGLYAFMRRVLATEHGKAIYRRRMASVEQVGDVLPFL